MTADSHGPNNAESRSPNPLLWDVNAVKDKIEAMLEGDKKGFFDEPEMNSLPGFITHLIYSGQEDIAETFAVQISSGLLKDQTEIRIQASQILSRLGRILIARNQIHIFLRMLPDWLKWIRSGTQPPTLPFRKMCIQLQDFAQLLIDEGRIAETIPILETFNDIYYGKIEKEDSVRYLAGDVLWNIASEETLTLMTRGMADLSEDTWADILKALTLLGGASIDFLLNILHKSTRRSERMRILDVVSGIGEPAALLLIRKLESGGPWFYLRNLVLMLGTVGSESHAKHLAPLLIYKDFRVQREALNSLYTIGGHERGPILLSVLGDSNNRMKLTIIEMLSVLNETGAVDPLLEQLRRHAKPQSKIEERLIEKTGAALGHLGDEKIIPELTKLIHAEPSEYSFPVREAALNALKKIDPMTDHTIKLDGFDVYLKNKVTTDKSMPASFEMGKFRLSDTVEESVVAMLYESIIQYARDKNFEKAETLREQLIETDPMAITEIVRAGEVIEEERNTTIELDDDHLLLWPNLYDALTPNESEALYDAIEEVIFESDRIVFRQGRRNNRLYFVRRGQLKQVYRHQDRERLLKTLGQGDIAGDDTFFNINYCTTSLITLSKSHLFYLDKNILRRLNNEFPNFSDKLFDHCRRLESIKDTLKKKGKDRRVHQRLKMTSSVMVQLLNESGKPTSPPFKSTVVDISNGGIAFGIRSTNNDNLRLLLGRKIEVTFALPRNIAAEISLEPSLEISEMTICQTGRVIAVSLREGGKYVLHVAFELTTDELIRNG